MIDLLVPNESEVLALAERSESGAFDQDRVIDALLEKGPRAVLITLGAGGVIYGEGEARVRRSAHAVQAVDTSGAGDAFIGAFAAAPVSGKPLASAIDFAQRAASISVTRRGAMPSLAYKHEME